MSKEKFRDWNPRRDINIGYVDGSGMKQFWTVNNQVLLGHVTRIVTKYMNQSIKLTNRQLFYQLVAEGLIPNAENVYKRVCKFLTDIRYAGIVDWKAIEDRGRVPTRHSQWKNIKELVESAVYSFRLPRWNDQDYYIELYTEKQALESIFKPIADKYHIYFCANKGYSSVSPIYDLSKRLANKIVDGKKAVVLYLGDFDASGLDMVRDITDRVDEFLTKGDNEFDTSMLQIIHVGLTRAQVTQYNPPPNPAKKTDPRSKKYMAVHGVHSWEVDALPPNVLIQLVDTAIRQFIDMKKYNAVIARENELKKKLQEFADSLIADESDEDDDEEEGADD
jgi:hypothetical protein